MALAQTARAVPTGLGLWLRPGLGWSYEPVSRSSFRQFSGVYVEFECEKWAHNILNLYNICTFTVRWCFLYNRLKYQC